MVHDADVIANVLQLAQVVRRDEHRCLMRGDVLQDDAPDLAAHHGVEAVDRLVENQIVGLRADGQPEGGLLLHALGKAAQRPLLVELEDFMQLPVAAHVEAGIELSHQFRHLADRVARVGGEIVRDEGHPPLDRRVFPNRESADRNRAGIRTVDARNAAKHRGFARAVRPHKAVDRAVRHGEAQIVQRAEAVERFGDILYLDHGSNSSLTCAQSASSLSGP